MNISEKNSNPDIASDFKTINDMHIFLFIHMSYAPVLDLQIHLALLFHVVFMAGAT